MMQRGLHLAHGHPQQLKFHGELVYGLGRCMQMAFTSLLCQSCDNVYKIIDSLRWAYLSTTAVQAFIIPLTTDIRKHRTSSHPICSKLF